MIKRYGFGLRAISVGHGESVKVPDVVEQPDGDYVRYEDHFAEVSKMVEQMEAIGAGGVGSERITRQGKSREQHRAEFARWYNKTYDDIGYVDVAWPAWCAARGLEEVF